MYLAWSHCQARFARQPSSGQDPCQMPLSGNETVQGGTLCLPFSEKFGKDASAVSRSARSFVYIKTILLLRVKAETRQPRKETRTRECVREKRLHQDPSTKASGLAHCRVFEVPETRRGGEETGKAWKKATLRRGQTLANLPQGVCRTC